MTRRRGSILGVILAVVGVSACDPAQKPIAENSGDIPSAYAAVLHDVLPTIPATTEPETSEPETTDEDHGAVVFVREFADEPLSLDEQVVVIDSFAPDREVRFIDKVDAAFDGDHTVDSGHVVGLGQLTREPPHTLRVEVIDPDLDLSALVVTLDWQDDEWRIVAREEVEPEVLHGFD